MKAVKLLFLLILCTFCFCGCKEKEKSGILFNTEPITKDNVMHARRNFEIGQPIYYLFYTPEKITSEFIRVQVFKVGDNIPRGGYTIIWTNEYRIMKQNMYYYHNHFTIHLKGSYVMQIFSMDDLIHPLAKNFFYVN